MRRAAAFLVMAACVRAPLEPPAGPRKPELWVDASAAEGGDGTAQRPLRTLAPPPQTVVHLAAGLYPFAGTLPDGAELVGHGAVVLHADGEVAAVATATRARLSHLAVQGGQWGLVARGDVALNDVSFSGQRQGGVRVESGKLELSGGTLEGSVPETRGVWVGPGAQASLRKVTLRGALRRGVDLESGAAELDDVQSEGAAEAVHQEGGAVTVRGLRAKGGRGPALFVVRGRLIVERAEVQGHEQALSAGVGSEVEVRGLMSDRAEIGAVALVQARATLSKLDVRRSGTHGAVESLDSTTVLLDSTVTDATELAVWARKGSLTVRNLKVLGVRSSGGSGGDAVMVRDATAKLEGITVSDAGGSGVVATAVANVELEGLSCTRCLYGALLVERLSTVKARGVSSVASREAAVNVPEAAQLELEGLEVGAGEAALWAECSAGAKVVVKGKAPQIAVSSCVDRRR